MGAQPKKKFINAIWVTGLYRDREIMGRTYRHHGQHWIILITDMGRSLIVPFDTVTNLKKITVVKEKLPVISTSFQHKKRFTAMEKLILATLSVVNN
ncbi:hypothetical protein [Pedobacter immunditicola]|uniref:hypothetical protein n=1 Tax=Pedobacter immunditicola TaxID=3133440 RepID=UPI0030987CFD